MKKPKDFIGLYITSTRIEAAQIVGAQDDPVLVNQHVADLPPDVLADDGSVQNPEALTSALQAFWSEAGFRCREVVLVLNSRKALVRQVKLPPMPLATMHQAILSEAEQFALFRDREPLIDYFATPPDMDFVMACYGAVANEIVEAYDKAIREAGLKLAAVDFVQLAGQRGMEFFHTSGVSAWVGVLVLPQRLIATSWKDGALKVMREILLPERVATAPELLAQNYLPEIVRSVSNEGNLPHDAALVVGCDRLSDTQTLADHAELLLGREVAIAGDSTWFTPDEPSEDAEPTDESKAVSYITLGAALWGRNGIVPSFNMISRRKVSGPAFKMPSLSALTMLKKPSEMLPTLTLPVAGLLALGILFGGWQLWTKSQREAQAKELAQQIQQVKVQLQENQQKLVAMPPEAELLRQWMPHHEENAFATNFLSTLREIIPSDTWLTKVTYASGREINLSGSSMNQTSCLYFADQIGGLSHVEQVRIVKLEKAGQVFSFEIQAGLGPAPVNEANP